VTRKKTGEAPGLLKRISPVLATLDSRLRQLPQPDPAAEPVEPSQVSVVIQGPVVGRRDDAWERRLTWRAVTSARQHLPGAEVILSTWRGSDTTGLPVDRVVLSDDPGSTAPRDPTHVPNNVNRQVVSTRAGLDSADRHYTLKLRSDMEMTGAGMLRLLHGWPARAADGKVLGGRIVVPTFYTFNPRRVYSRFPYMVSDWAHFGTTADMADVWSTPHWDPAFEWLLGRRIVPSEQWVWMSLLNRHDEDAFIGRPDVLEHSELLMVNNAIVVEAVDMGVSMLKFVPHLGHQTAVVTHGEWQRLYERLCVDGGSRRRGRLDAQGALRTVVDRAWIRGLALPLIGPPADLVPSPRPLPPPTTPDTSTVAGPPDPPLASRLHGLDR